MRNLKRLTFALAAAGAIFCATPQPVLASTCEDLCYQDYWYCRGIISPPGTCNLLLQICLSECP